MTGADGTPDELDTLLASLVDGELTPDERERLAVILRDQPDVRARYLDYLLLDSMLQWEPPELVLAEPAPSEASTPARSPRRLWFVTVAAAALVAGIALGVTLWPKPIANPRTQPTPEQAAVEPTDDSVAILLHSSGATWGNSTLPTRAGSPLPPGRLHLLAGVVRLEFYCGATVILEGPADFHLISKTMASCSEGRLRANVPPHADGFTIQTPKIDLVDRGTEFGLRVGEAGRTEVHVFQGRVDLHTAGAASAEPPLQKLLAGQAYRVVGNAADGPIAPDPAAFMTSQKLERQIAVETARRELDWAAAIEDWRRDPALLMHYSFQGAPAASRTLADQVGRLPAPDGTIVGCPWVPGRWHGRQALEFRRVTDRVRLNIPGEFRSLTLVAWARPDSLPNVNHSLLMADGWEEGEPHWQIGTDGTVILGIRGPPDYNPEPNVRGPQYRAHEVITPERLGRWVQLAVVYDADRGEVVHYLDGRVVARSSIQLDLKLRIGEAEIGNWNVASFRSKSPVRNFNGVLDEFLMFSRALHEAEIEKLYAQGRPPL